jgi:hypothetical protein
MLNWMWFLAISILADIEGISMIIIGHLGIAERIAMAVLLVLQVTLFFLVCWLYIRKSYRNKEIK